MESKDEDLNFVKNLAAKYKSKGLTDQPKNSITLLRKDRYVLGISFLILGGLILVSSINAFNLKQRNIILKNTLSQATQQENANQPNETFLRVNNIPGTYKRPETCAWPLEIPPTLIGEKACESEQKPAFNNPSI